MPYPVISGFMSGVGFIIITLQVGPLLGHPETAKVIDALQQMPGYFANINPYAAGLGGLTLAIIFGAPARLNRVLPAPLIALVVGTLISVVRLPGAATPLIPYDAITRINDIPSGLPTLHWPALSYGNLQLMLGYGLMLATLGALDSLLTSMVADNITRTQHDSDRELIGQGIGNLLSGILGGLPGAGATMRTVVNVKAGGKTALSGIIHAIVLLLIVVKAGPLTEPIPSTVLAGILLKVGIDIIDWGFIKRAHRLSTKGAGVMYLVLGLTVFVNLIVAVAVGVFVANLLTVKHLTDLQVKEVKAVTRGEGASWLSPREQALLSAAKGRVLMFHLSGPMSFGAAKAFSRRLSIVGNYDVLILDLDNVPRLGVTAVLALETLIKDALDQRRDVFLVGASGQVDRRLHCLDVLQQLPPTHQVPNRTAALERSLTLLHLPIPAAVAAP